MNVDPETTRSIRTWLQADRHEDPHSVLQAVLEAVETTPQRRATRWPDWRLPPTITAARFGLASALVAVATLVGLNVVARNAPIPALGAPPAATASAAAAGLLVYELDGAIYLADSNGGYPIRVAHGQLQQSTMPGSVWSPDGRHFLYFSDGSSMIADARGTLVSTLDTNVPGGSFSSGPYWSPDSSRLNQWMSSTAIGVFGIDGKQLASLPLPNGYRRHTESEGVWAPDGRSVFVRIEESDHAPEAWELPIDGSAPRQLLEDHPFAQGVAVYSRDGHRVAYASTELVVANADGSDARSVVEPEAIDPLPYSLTWSPDGARLAYIASRGDQFDLAIVDVATATASIAVHDFGTTAFGWSSASDKLLFAGLDDRGATSLWRVDADGTGRTLLVTGATWGAMPPPGASDAAPDGPGERVDATPSPATIATPVAVVPPYPNDVIPAVGPLAAGTYSLLDIDSGGINARFTVPDGWRWDGRSLHKDGVGQRSGAAILFFGHAADLHVPADPCRWKGAASTVATKSIDGVVAALALQPSRSPTMPPDWWAASVNLPDSSRGLVVDLRVPAALDLTGCDEGEYRSWSIGDLGRSHEGAGQRDRVSVIDIYGINSAGQSVPGGMIIDAASFPDTPPAVMAEIDVILKSIHLGHWG